MHEEGIPHFAMNGLYVQTFHGDGKSHRLPLLLYEVIHEWYSSVEIECVCVVILLLLHRTNNYMHT